MTRKMNGKSLAYLYDAQINYQKEVTGIGSLPKDNLKWFIYHVSAMSEEMGEVMKADKRWKTHRNVNYNRAEKLDEIADVIITGMNLAIFSGFSAYDLAEAINNKIYANLEKFEIEKEGSK